jgi:hypothetical protein
MRHLIEKHLDRVGSRRALLLITMAIMWSAVATAVVVWALAKGVMESFWITLAVRSGDPVDIAVAVALWSILLITVPLARAVLAIRRAWRDERWRAQAALNALEARYPDVAAPSRHLENPRERLAVRGIEALETLVTGAPAEAGGDFEPRLIELGRRIEARPEPTRDVEPPTE